MWSSPQYAWAATLPVIETVANATKNPGAISLSYTIAAGLSNSMLVVFEACFACVPDVPTWNGTGSDVALTLDASYNVSGGDDTIAVYYVLSPTAKTGGLIKNPASKRRSIVAMTLLF